MEEPNKDDKIQMSFYVTHKLRNAFVAYCSSNFLIQSKVLEQMLKKYMEDKQNETENKT